MLKTIQYAALIAAVALAIVFAGISAWRSFQDQPHHQTTNESGSKETQKEADDVLSPQGTNEAIARYNWWLAIFTGVLAITSILLFAANIFIFAATNSGAKAAKQSANAAIDTVKTMRAQLRAYISIGRGRPNETEDFFIMPLQNVGQTPAKSVSGHLNMQWYGDGRDLPDDFTFPDLGNRGGGSITTLVAGQETEMRFSVIPEKLESARAGTISLFLYGHIDYTDIFDNKQVCTFCYKIRSLPDGKAASQVWSVHNDCS